MRNIDPKTWEDEWFGQQTERHRLFWLGLITLIADDQGRFTNQPVVIARRVFIYDDGITGANIRAMLDDFIQAGKLHAYTADGKELLQIINWWRYQSGAAWMSPSHYPAPEGWTDRCRHHGPARKIITYQWDHPGGFVSLLPSGLGSGLGSPLPSDKIREVKKREDKRSKEDAPGAAAADAGFIPDDPPMPDDPETQPTPEPAPVHIMEPASGFIPSRGSGYTNYSFSQAHVDAERLIATASGLPTVPPTERQRLEQVATLISQYGYEPAKAAMIQAVTKWCATRRRDNSGYYKKTNLTWVDWAMEILAAPDTPSGPARLPMPSMVCPQGKRMAENDDRDTYATHLKTCSVCGQASNIQNILEAINA